MLASLGTEAAASSVYAVILSRENVRLPGHLTDHAGHASEGGEWLFFRLALLILKNDNFVIVPLY